MVWLILLVLIAGFVALYVRSSSKKAEPPRAASSLPSRPAQPLSRPNLAADEARIHRQVEAKAARMMPQIEAEAARMQPEIEAEAARIEMEALREASLIAFEEDDPEPLKDPPRVLWREDYVPKEEEGRYLTRRADGRPNLYLVDAGDRLAIWSPVDGGGLINPRGPGLRHLGLYASQARGATHYGSAYLVADLSKGRWLDLIREPENLHDKNAVAMCAPGSRIAFAYVQRGRAPAVARRMDAGEAIAAVSMRGPGKGRADQSTLVLIGSRTDLSAMLNA